MSRASNDWIIETLESTWHGGQIQVHCDIVVDSDRAKIPKLVTRLGLGLSVIRVSRLGGQSHMEVEDQIYVYHDA